VGRLPRDLLRPGRRPCAPLPGSRVRHHAPLPHAPPPRPGRHPRRAPRAGAHRAPRPHRRRARARPRGLPRRPPPCGDRLAPQPTHSPRRADLGPEGVHPRRAAGFRPAGGAARAAPAPPPALPPRARRWRGDGLTGGLLTPATSCHAPPPNDSRSADRRRPTFTHTPPTPIIPSPARRRLQWTTPALPRLPTAARPVRERSLVNEWDVIVVGAGPAGSAAARLLAARGHAVLLLDRERFPRAKPCGDCLSAAVSPLLARLGLLDAVLAEKPARLRGWQVFAPSGVSFSGGFGPDPDDPSRATTALAIPREMFDHVLL